ncbi:hypothetical protein IQ260_23360, partial [Leptolyngbya cf. ectocarpi LEGE 11479]
MIQPPPLPERESLIKKFSTYIQVAHQTIQWCSDSRLAKNFKLYEENLADKQEFTLLRIYIESALERPRQIHSWESKNNKRCKEYAIGHLRAYCDEACYWATYKVFQRTQEILRISRGVAWEDCFQIARTSLLDTEKFSSWLSSYDFDRSHNFNSYIQKILERQLQDQLSVGKVSRWRRLYKASDKKLTEALKHHQGIQEPWISHRLFARKYFRETYHIRHIANPNRTKNQKWPTPNMDDYAEIARQYNADRLLKASPYSVLVSSSSISAETMKNWMESSIQALDAYSLSVTSSQSLEELFETRGYETADQDSNSTLEYFFKLSEPLAISQLEERQNSNSETLIEALYSSWKKYLAGLDEGPQ